MDSNESSTSKRAYIKTQMLTLTSRKEQHYVIRSEHNHSKSTNIF